MSLAPVHVWCSAPYLVCLVHCCIPQLLAKSLEGGHLNLTCEGMLEKHNDQALVEFTG